MRHKYKPCLFVFASLVFFTIPSVMVIVCLCFQCCNCWLIICLCIDISIVVLDWENTRICICVFVGCPPLGAALLWSSLFPSLSLSFNNPRIMLHYSTHWYIFLHQYVVLVRDGQGSSSFYQAFRSRERKNTSGLSGEMSIVYKLFWRSR